MDRLRPSWSRSVRDRLHAPRPAAGAARRLRRELRRPQRPAGLVLRLRAVLRLRGRADRGLPGLLRLLRRLRRLLLRAAAEPLARPEGGAIDQHFQRRTRILACPAQQADFAGGQDPDLSKLATVSALGVDNECAQRQATRYAALKDREPPSASPPFCDPCERVGGWLSPRSP